MERKQTDNTITQLISAAQGHHTNQFTTRLRILLQLKRIHFLYSKKEKKINKSWKSSIVACKGIRSSVRLIGY